MPFFAGVLLVVAVGIAYSNSLNGPFVFDDIASIIENPTIRRLVSADVWWPPPGLTVSGRPLVNVSLAFNYAIGGTDVRGYHVTNVIIHVLAALVLFDFLRRTFLQPRLRERLGRAANSFAFGVALLWALHPLQTESVTYVIQRAESLAGLFYLLTLACFARSIGSLRPVFWQSLCVVSCFLGMATKEVVVSAPLAVLLYDRIFVASSLRELRRTRGGFYSALASSWLLLAWLVWTTGGRAGTAGFFAGVGPWEYALTQSRAVLQYLWLTVWPHPLVFDYGPYDAPRLNETGPALLALALLLAGTIYLVRQRPAAAFAVTMVVLLLAPTSSVLPVVTEPIAEHRMYLPLAAVIALAVVGLRQVFGRWAAGAVLIAAFVFGVLTFQRNEVYRSARSLWQATVQAVPDNPRAQGSLAWALLEERDYTAAETRFQRVLALQPTSIDARRGLARLFEEQGRASEAAQQHEAILRSRPDDFIAHNGLGHVYFQRGDFSAAARHFEQAVRAQPDSAAAHSNLGAIHFELGNFSAARSHQETALRLRPDYAEAHYNLGNALAAENRSLEACDAYARALRLAPDYVEAHVNLAAVLQSLGAREDAIRHYREALRLHPNFPFAQKNLERLLAAPPSR